MRPEQNNETVQIFTGGLASISPPDVTASKKQMDGKMKIQSEHKRGIVDCFSKSSQCNFKVVLTKSAPFMAHFITLNPHDAFFFGYKGPKARIKRFDVIRKKVMAWLEERNISGFVKVEYECRKSGYFTGQPLPHMHLVVTKQFEKYDKEFKTFWLGNQELEKPGYHSYLDKAAAKSYDSRPIQTDTKAWISYLCKPHDNRALEALDGYYIEKGRRKEYHAGFSIGRAWFKIGIPPVEVVPKQELNPTEGKIFRRLLKNYITAQVKKHNSRKRTISTGRKLSIMNQGNGSNVFIGKTDAQRLLDLARELAKTKVAIGPRCYENKKAA